jgi:hypothetical protein
MVLKKNLYDILASYSVHVRAQICLALFAPSRQNNVI